MSNLAQSIRNHREEARNRRALNRAIERAGSAAARDDIIAAWQHADARR